MQQLNSASQTSTMLSESTFRVEISNSELLPKKEYQNFDWNSDVWEEVIAAVSRLVKEASVDWDKRRFTPDIGAQTIRDLFDRPMPNSGEDLTALLGTLQQVIDCSGYNGHPRWFAYITSSPDPVGVLGSFFAAAINQNNNLWRIAPAATSIELQCIEWFKEMFDLSGEWEGIFSSGGQMSNIIACAIARQMRCPWDVRRHGVAGPTSSGRMRIYTSDQAHYCHHQAAELLGLGSEALRVVPSDDSYRMRVDMLAEMIEQDKAQGDIPIMVIATAGTVGTGAIDPLADIRTLSEQENLWFHIDGAYGLPAYLSPDAAPALAPMQTADSLSFDPHKWLYSPIDAGVTLVRQPGALRQTFGFQVSYLDQSALNNCRVDLVDFTPENSRPARAIKVWLSLLAHGVDRFRFQITQDMALTQYMGDYIERSNNLVLLSEPSLSIVCWRVEPEALRGNETALNELQLKIIETLENRGDAFLSKAKLKGDKIAIRACIVNFRTQKADVEATLAACEAVGIELVEQVSAR
ncbi:MAG: pyridoxal-dependent decarboxylase [Cyanobacteria bacterium P01_D01_bin.1]